MSELDTINSKIKAEAKDKVFDYIELIQLCQRYGERVLKQKKHL